MIDRTELDRRLKGWADEYGGGKYENVGWRGRNLLQTLIEHQGFVPSSAGYVPIPIRSAADEVETVVRDMETSGWLRHARALRCDYFQPDWAIDQRLRAMRQLGCDMSRTAYYDALAQAKAFVAGALSKTAAA